MNQTINHESREHASHSPSSLEKRELCAAWTPEENQETVYAEAGTRCHEAVEAYLRNDESVLDALPPDLQGYVRNVLSYAQPRVAGSEKLILEERVYADHPTLREHCHGTPDLLAITGKKGILMDWKFGRRPVTHASKNLQGWTYGVAIFDSYPQLEELEIHFVVPRVHENTSSHTFTRANDYDMMLGRALTTVDKSLAKEPEEKPTWSACTYCGRRAKCSEIGKLVARITGPDELKFYVKRLIPALLQTTPDALAQQMRLATVAEQWGKDKREDLLRLAIEEGKEVGGYELRFAKGRTTATSLTDVNLALQKAGLEELMADATKFASISLTELRKAASLKLSGDKKEVEERLMTALAEGGALKTGDESPYLFRLNEQK